MPAARRPLGRVDAGRELPVQLARVERLECRSQHPAVLAYLERREMEAERLDLPAEVLEASPQATRLIPASTSAAPKFRDLGQQDLGAGVATRERRRRPRQVRARAAQALRDRAEAPADGSSGNRVESCA